MAVSNVVLATIRGSEKGITYDTLRSKVNPPDRAVFDRQVIQAMRTGQITIKAGKYVSRSK